jgi:hypothetical protein
MSVWTFFWISRTDFVSWFFCRNQSDISNVYLLLLSKAKHRISITESTMTGKTRYNVSILELSSWPCNQNSATEVILLRVQGICSKVPYLSLETFRLIITFPIDWQISYLQNTVIVYLLTSVSWWKIAYKQVNPKPLAIYFYLTLVSILKLPGRFFH